MFMLFSGLSATNYMSNQNGNWMNPMTWTPVGIPLPGDNVTINHAVTLDTSFAYTSGTITVNSNGSLTQDSPIRDLWVNGSNASFFNSGFVDVRYLLVSDGGFTNSGNLNAQSLANFASFDNTMSGLMNGLDSLYNNGIIDNRGVVNVSTFFNDSTINNYGVIQGLVTLVDSMYNKGYFLNDAGAIIYADSCTNDGIFYNAGRLLFSQFTNLNGNFDNVNYMQLGDMTNIGDFDNIDSLIITNNLTNLGYFNNQFAANVIEVNNIYNNGYFINGSYINSTGSMYNDSIFYNQVGSLIDLDISFLNGDTLSSNAYFITSGELNIGDSYFNFDSLYGYNQASISVQDTSYNHSTGKMKGSFDFCDATPPATSPFIDFNFGIVDPTVTYCIVGVEENLLLNKTLIYPNPTTGLINIQYNDLVIIEIYNLLGEQILVTQQKQVDLSNNDNGVYLFRIKDREGKILSLERIIKQ